MFSVFLPFIVETMERASQQQAASRTIKSYNRQVRVLPPFFSYSEILQDLIQEGSFLSEAGNGFANSLMRRYDTR